MKNRRRQNREAGIDRRVAQHVLQELLADEHGAHQRTHDDDAAHGRHPEGRACGDLQVVERVLGAALADDEQDERD